MPTHISHVFFFKTTPSVHQGGENINIFRNLGISLRPKILKGSFRQVNLESIKLK